MGFNPGTGGTIGGPPTPQQYELSTSAAQVNAQINLGITSDMLENPVSNMMRTAVWKYLANASNPNLTTYLSQMRVSTAVKDESDTLQNEHFTRLWNALPDDVLQRYNLEMTLPAEEQDPAFINLRTTVQMMAYFAAWVSGANPSTDVSKEALERNAAYLSLPEQAQRGMVSTGLELLQGMRQYLETIGRNNPVFDSLSPFINQFDAAITELNSSSKADLSKLAGDLEIWTTQFQRYSGNDLQVLGQLMPLMSLVAAAGALGTGSASLLLGLGTAFIGINRADSSTGILPSDLSALVSLLSTGMLATLLPNADKGSVQLLKLLTSGLYIGAVTIAALARDGLSTPLLFDLSMTAALSSNVFTTVTEAIAAAAGATERTKELAGSALSLTTVLLMIMAYAGKDQARAAALAESFKPYLSGWIEQLEPVVSSAAGRSNDSKITSLNVHLQQGKVALETDNYPEFIATVESMLEGIAPARNKNEEMNSFTANISKNVNIDSNKPITNIFQG